MDLEKAIVTVFPSPCITIKNNFWSRISDFFDLLDLNSPHTFSISYIHAFKVCIKVYCIILLCDPKKLTVCIF